MSTCLECIHYERCDTVFDGLLSNRDNKSCCQFDNKSGYLKLPCRVGDTIYFTGYGVVEELIVAAISVEFNKTFIDNCIGYVDAYRYNGSCESLGFNVFGELFFTSKEAAEKALSKPEVVE
jgi:hypothetical protein